MITTSGWRSCTSLDDFDAVADVTDHHKVFLPFQEGSNARANNFMILGQQDTNHPFPSPRARMGNSISTRVP